MGQSSSQFSATPPNQSTVSGTTSCPVDHRPTQAEYPVSHQTPVSPPPAQCPVSHSSPASINPLNQMPPDLAQTPHFSQSSTLPTERIVSSIPRDHSGTTWEYPSPQQFYNALVRKGWETPEEHVETMVDIHNFLNEAAWNEVLKWEKRIDPRRAQWNSRARSILTMLHHLQL
jgi:cytochrome c heme-lyase